MGVVDGGEERAGEDGADHDPDRVAPRPPGGGEAAEVGERDEHRERAEEQHLVAHPAREAAALPHEADAAGGRVEREVEGEHEQRAQRDRGQQPADHGGAGRVAAAVAQPADHGERQHPRGHGIGPGVDAVEEAERQRGREQLRERAPARRQARAVQHDLHREGEREQRERHREHVRVEVAEQEREPRELRDRVVDHPRGREPVVVAERAAVGEQDPGALEVAQDDDQRHGAEAGADGLVRPAGGGPERGGEGEDRGGGERQQRRDGDVVALVGTQVAELHEHAHGEVAEVVVVEVAAGEPGVLGRERVRAVGGVQERHVHRLLGEPDVGRVGDEQDGGATKVTVKTASAAQKRRVRSGSGSGTRAASRRQRRRASQPFGSPRASGAAALPAADEGEEAERADERDPQRRAQPPVRDQRGGAAHPDEPRDEGEAEHLGHAEARAGQAREHDPRQGRRAEADQLDERPEAQRLGHGKASSRVGGTASVDSGAPWPHMTLSPTSR